MLEHRSVTKLSLKGNGIGIKGITEIGKMLENPNCNVEELDVSNNKIGTLGLHKLCSSLTKNKSLMKINI